MRNFSLIHKALAGSILVRPLGMLLGLLVGIQLARGLGPAGYGIYGVALSVVTILGAFADFGLPTLITREASKALAVQDWPQFIGILRWAQRRVVLISLVTILLSAGYISFFGDQTAILGRTILIGLILIPVVALQRNICAVIRSLKFIVLGQIPETIVRPLVMVVLLMVVSVVIDSGINPQLAMGFQVISAILALTLARVFLSRNKPLGSQHIVPEYSKKAWLQSVYPMALTEWVRVLQGHIAVLVLALIVAESELGFFRAAVSVGAVVALPLSVVNIVCMPLIANALSGSRRQELRGVLQFSVFSMFLGVGGSTLAILLAGELIIGTIFGVDYAATLQPLKILSVGYFVGSFFGPGTVFLTMSGHEKCVTRSYVTSLFFLVITTVTLSCMYGIIGASIAVACSFVFLCFLQWKNSKELESTDISLIGAVRGYYHL